VPGGIGVEDQPEPLRTGVQIGQLGARLETLSVLNGQCERLQERESLQRVATEHHELRMSP
jgi:hypothetical protein